MQICPALERLGANSPQTHSVHPGHRRTAQIWGRRGPAAACEASLENLRLWDPGQKAMVVTRKRHDYLHFPGKAESHALGRRETTTLGSQVSLWECGVGVSKAGGPCNTPFHPHPPSHMVKPASDLQRCCWYLVYPGREQKGFNLQDYVGTDGISNNKFNLSWALFCLHFPDKM